MKPTKNSKKLKQPVPQISDELREAVRIYLQVKANRELIEPVVLGYQREILARHQFPLSKRWTDGEGRRRAEPIILEPKDDYLMEDDAFKNVYMPALEAAKAEYGFGAIPEGYCPLLVAKGKERKARWAVMRAAMYITNIAPEDVWNMEIQDHLVDLTVKLVLNAAPMTTAEIMQDMGAHFQVPTSTPALTAALDRGNKPTKEATPA